MNEHIFNDRAIKPHWSKNWGDQIALMLLKALSDKVVNRNFSNSIKEENIFGLLKPSQENGRKNGKLISVGSVMNYTQPNDFVWGTGCISQKSVGKKPKHVSAVRGPLTRHEITSLGWACPEIYGDPVLLMPMVHSIKPKHKYKWGIIPHYVEFESETGLKTLKNLERLGFKIIDICSGNMEFLNELEECDRILSTSLHGLIISDAYGIPNARVSITGNLVGNHFKFVDYFMSVHRPIQWTQVLTDKTTMADIDKLQLNDKIYFDANKLLNAAPWYLDNFRTIL